MHSYTLINPITGDQWTLDETMLTQNLMPNCVLLRDGEHIGIITHRDLVLFARWCAGVTAPGLRAEPDQSATYALSLVDRWLKDQQSVTTEELEAARNAAWDVWVDARTAEAVTEAAVEAAWVATRAALDVRRGVWVARAAKITRSFGISLETQAQWLVEHLQSGK